MVLPGWEKSRGSILELHVAQYIGLKVYQLSTVLKASKLAEENNAQTE